MSESDILKIKQRLALIEARQQQLFEAMNIAPRQAPDGDGWWGGSEGGGADADPASVAEQDSTLQKLITEQRTIEAAKRYRELTGEGLAESKKAVERLGA
jgi:ribosomal protein L7/L12